MNEEMMKSLVSLIDETIAEVEELKKSDRFSASEIKLDGPGSGIGGQDPDGKLGKEEDKDEEDEDDDKDAADKKDKKDDKDMDKAEGKNREADPNGGHHQVVKEEDAVDKAEGKNREADPNGGSHQAAKEEAAKADTGMPAGTMAKSDAEEFIKKSAEESSTLLKSYVDERITPIEDKLEKMMGLIKEIADAPVPSRGQTFKGVQPLHKSADGHGESLTKSQIIDKLFELKKSGEKVDTVDITSAELGKPADLTKIATKYNLNS